MAGPSEGEDVYRGALAASVDLGGLRVDPGSAKDSGGASKFPGAFSWRKEWLADLDRAGKAGC